MKSASDVAKQKQSPVMELAEKMGLFAAYSADKPKMTKGARLREFIRQHPTATPLELAAMTGRPLRAVQVAIFMINKATSK